MFYLSTTISNRVQATFGLIKKYDEDDIPVKYYEH